MNKQWYVYILTNKKNGTLYTGVNSDLMKRVREHKNKVCQWFTKKYTVDILVYYEDCGDIETAIQREKYIKAWNRNRKLKLIESTNPDRNDLYGTMNN